MQSLTYYQTFRRGMLEQGDGITARWCRFSDYEIVEDAWPPKDPRGLADHFRFIRPSQNARLEVYRPTVVPVGDVLPGDEAIGLEALQQLDLEDEQAILSWCKKFGLLGLLSHTTMSIHLAPRWLKAPGVGPPDHILFPVQTQYFRTNSGWQGIDALGGGEPIRVGEEYPFDEWYDQLVDPEDTPLRAGAIVTRLFSNHYEELGLERAIGPYFPDIPPKDRVAAKYLMPGSPDFWYQYGESLAQFRHAVQGFIDIAKQLKNLGPLADAPIEAVRSLLYGREQLRSLLSVWPDSGLAADGSFNLQWGFSSLLAMFALSITQDLAGGKSIRQCKRSRCRKIYVSATHNRDYCTKQCRWAEEKARHRRS